LIRIGDGIGGGAGDEVAGAAAAALCVAAGGGAGPPPRWPAECLVPSPEVAVVLSTGTLAIVVRAQG
jgi:hypothetical protein